MIRLNGIDIPYEGTTDINILVPLFNDMDSYSFPFTIPWSDELRLATNFADHPDTDLIGNEYSLQLSGGGLYFSGICTITDNTEDGLEVAFIDNGTFYGKIKDKLLTELADDIRLLGIDKIKTLSDSLKQEGYDYVCPPFINSKIAEGWGINVSEKCNDFDTETGKLSTSNRIIAPMPYLFYAIKRIFHDNGYQLISSLFQNNYYSKLFLYSNVSIVNFTFDRHLNDYTGWDIIKISNEKEPTATVLVKYNETRNIRKLDQDSSRPVVFNDMPNVGEDPIPITDFGRCVLTHPLNNAPVTITDILNLTTYYALRIISSNPLTNKTTIEANDKFVIEGNWTDGPGEWIDIERRDDDKFYELQRGTEAFPSPVKRETVYRIGTPLMPELHDRNVQFECDEDGSYNANYGGYTFDFKIPFVDSTDFAVLPRKYYSVKKITKGYPTTIFFNEEFETTRELWLKRNDPLRINFVGGRIQENKSPQGALLPMTIYVDGNTYYFQHIPDHYSVQNTFQVLNIGVDKKSITLMLDTSSWGDDILNFPWGLKINNLANSIAPTYPAYSYEDINLTKSLPNIKITDFIANLQKYLGWFFFVNEATNSCTIERIDRIFSSVEATDLTEYASPIRFASNEADNFGLRIAPENEAAFESVKELPTDAVIKPTVATLNALPEIEENGAFRLVTATNCWYRFTYQMMGSGGVWEKYSDNISLQKGEESFNETIASHIYYDETQNPPLIKSEQAGTNYKLWDLQERATPLLLAHYEGMHLIEEKQRPVVSVNNPQYSTFEHNLTLDKSACLYNKIWAPYFYWNKNIRRDGVSIIQYPSHQLASMQLWKKIKIGSTNCLIKEIAVTMNHKTDSLSFGETKLVRC